MLSKYNNKYNSVLLVLFSLYSHQGTVEWAVIRKWYISGIAITTPIAPAAEWVANQLYIYPVK